ncbi:sentrin-specific protease 1-like isoform X2 [Zootermopsis nevadensis]|uniref:sentrin-specific protease 1-like isoform X2 n=1 Tax=Zootermopsis nevadensis TaxID=136037 RepID=UPI000B8E2AE3|nr:sentrin-specific protease 1-like isoform X2 [Zootermopsis nevadensis]
MYERILLRNAITFWNRDMPRRSIDDTEDDELTERSPKQRRIETAEKQKFFTSDQFLRPSPNWRMPKKRPVISCRQQQRHVDMSQPCVQVDGPQPGCSWFDDLKENIQVSDDEDVDVLGVWQDANTLRKRNVFKAGNDVKRTTYSATSQSVDKPDEDDIQVIKVVGSHKDEISQSGNTMSIFQTPSAKFPPLVRHFAMDSANSCSSKRSQVLPHPKSSHSKFSQDSNGSHSCASSRSSHTEKGRLKLALSESFRLEEKVQYSELLQRFTNVPLQAQSRHHRAIWNPCVSEVKTRGQSSQHSDFAGHAREKLSKQLPIVIDLTKPQQCWPLPGKHIRVRRDREAEPYTATSKQDEDETHREFCFKRSNSLADALKSNYFCTEDFLSTLDEKYKKKHEARKRQEEEEKVKATHFHEREKKLQVESLERMAKYLKITDAIIDDDVIFEEEKLVLPELTPNMQAVVDDALIPKPPNEVLVEAFGLPIKRRDMQTLAGLNWLNDEVINFYMELLKERGKLENYPSVYAFNTFFYPRLLSGGHTALKRWTRKVDIFSYNLVIVPVHLGVHWCLAAVDFRNKTIKYYDSMGSSNYKCLQSLMKYLQDESLDKKKTPFNTSGWKTENVQKIPQQMNGSDCGMFSCMYAEFICRNADIIFTQEDMPYFRRKMVYEICSSKLLM